MKMYILIKENLPAGIGVLAAAHASLACYLKFKDSPEVADWLSGPFYKVVCRVDETAFVRAKDVDDSVIITESSLDNMEVAMAFKPRPVWPKQFKFFALYK